MLMKLFSWDKGTYDAAQEQREKEQSQFAWDAPTKPTPERESIAEQAKALLSGKEAWKPTPQRDEWEDVGDAVEVEQDVEVPPVQR
jgi:large subunit ribosomal protein L23